MTDLKAAAEVKNEVPIMREVPEKSKTAELAEQELDRLFIDRMKQYADASKKARRTRGGR